jgi:hypothetical protein
MLLEVRRGRADSAIFGEPHQQHRLRQLNFLLGNMGSKKERGRKYFILIRNKIFFPGPDSHQEKKEKSLIMTQNKGKKEENKGENQNNGAWEVRVASPN